MGIEVGDVDDVAFHWERISARNLLMVCARSQDSRSVKGGLVLLLRRGKGGSFERDVVRFISPFASEENTFTTNSKALPWSIFHGNTSWPAATRVASKVFMALLTGGCGNAIPSQCITPIRNFLLFVTLSSSDCRHGMG